MGLNNTEEILPLLNYKTAESSTRIQYQSFSSNTSNNITSETLCLQEKKPKENYSLSDSLNEDLKTDFHFKKCQRNDCETCHKKLRSNQKIAYIWKNMNAYEIAKPRSKFWKINYLKPDKISETRNKILQNAYGMAVFGELLAIMGSSGAGKTTLLNALTFQSSSKIVIEGRRYLNGHLLHDRDSISRISAYAEQDPLFFGNLTIKEHLIFQALVRTDRAMSYSEKLNRVDEIINELELGRCKDTQIKGISGGERKRLSFASEVITNPSIMFCDEPTSGLDSFMALNITQVLKSMAIKGKAVICTIHQPSSDIFSLFDKILLLAEGKTAFFGTPNEAVSFFNELGAAPLYNYNPADYYIQLLAIVPHREEHSRRTIKFICDYFDQSLYGSKIMYEIEQGNEIQEGELKMTDHFEREFFMKTSKHQKYMSSWYSQFKALFWRSWLNIRKEVFLTKVRVFQTLVLSMVVVLIYYKQKLNEDGVMNINGALFTFLTNMTFQNLFAVISVFCSELPIVLKENSNKMYRVDAYFISKTLAEIPLFIAIPTIFTAITYFGINLNPSLNHFGFTLLILILVTNVATSFGYLISCVSKNVVMALSIGPPIVIPFLLFGGFLLNIRVIPSYFEWLSYLSWFKYGNEALLINQWYDIDFIECTKFNSTCPKNGSIVLKTFHFQKSNFLNDIFSLLILIVFFRVLAFAALLLKAIRYHV